MLYASPSRPFSHDRRALDIMEHHPAGRCHWQTVRTVSQCLPEHQLSSSSSPSCIFLTDGLGTLGEKEDSQRHWQISSCVEKMPAYLLSALHGVGRSLSGVCHCESKGSRPKYLPSPFSLSCSHLLSLPAGVRPCVLTSCLAISGADGLCVVTLSD